VHLADHFEDDHGLLFWELLSDTLHPLVMSHDCCDLGSDNWPSPARSPVERVVKVVKAAIRNSFKRKRPQATGSSSGYDGPVNLPEGIAAAMRKTHSYMWLDNAVKDTSAPEGAASGCPALLSARPQSTHVPWQMATYRLRLHSRPNKYAAVRTCTGRAARDSEPVSLPAVPAAGPTTLANLDWAEAAVIFVMYIACRLPLTKLTLMCPATPGLVVEGYTPEQVEEVRMVVRLLPVFFTTILYWTVYAQMGTFFIMQARRSPLMLCLHGRRRCCSRCLQMLRLAT
jgi:hypothetical protein